MSGTRMTDTRERILQAAIDLFAVKGYSRTSMKSIAEKASVNETTIFRVFGSKDKLFLEAFLQLTPDPSQVDITRYSFADDLTEQLAHLFKIYMILHIDHMPAYRLSMLIDAIYDHDIYYNAFLRIKGLITQLVDYLEGLHAAGRIKKVDFESMSELMFSLFLVKATEFIVYGTEGASYDEAKVEMFAEEYAQFFAQKIAS